MSTNNGRDLLFDAGAPLTRKDTIARTLKQMRLELLAKIGMAGNGSLTSGMATLLNGWLATALDELYWAGYWPELVKTFTVTTQAGLAIYDLPTLGGDYLEPSKVESVACQNGAAVTPMREGITPAHYNQPGQQLPTRYEIRDGVELWPTPNGVYTILLKGMAGPRRFTSDDDACCLRPSAVMLFAISYAKAHYKQADAQLYLLQAEKLRRRLASAAHRNRRYLAKGSSEIADVAIRPLLVS